MIWENHFAIIRIFDNAKCFRSFYIRLHMYVIFVKWWKSCWYGKSMRTILSITNQIVFLKTRYNESELRIPVSPVEVGIQKRKCKVT